MRDIFEFFQRNFWEVSPVVFFFKIIIVALIAAVIWSIYKD
jgi:hypothetical protein